MSEIIRRTEKEFPDQLEHGQELFGNQENFGPGIEFLEDLCRGNETLQKLLDDMLDSCYRYAQDVFKMEQMVASGFDGKEDAAEFARIDKQRTRLHDATIDNVNILSRALIKAGRDSEWVKEIHYGGRPAYSRFALTITFNQYLRFRRQQEEQEVKDEPR